MTQTVKEAILSTQMQEVVKRLDKIDTKLDEQSKHYVSEEQFRNFKEEYNQFKKSIRINYVVVVLVTAIITALVYSFFNIKL